MSRLKRQRLTVDGHDRVTIDSVDDVHFETHEAHGKIDDSQAEQQQGRSLFVRSLPALATSESLTAFFSQTYPLKHAMVVVDSATKQSKGYGFVTFADIEDAQSAKETFNGSLFEGRRIKVELAEPRHRQSNPDKPGGSTTNRRSATFTKAKTEGDWQNQPLPKLIVRNLPWTIKEPEQLALLFRSYGKVKHATMPKKKPGLSPGFGFVVLRGRKNAERALEGVNGKEIEGRTLAVDWAVDKDVWENLQKRDDEPGENQDHESVKSEDADTVLKMDDIVQSDIERDDVSLEDDAEECLHSDSEDNDLDEDDNKGGDESMHKKAGTSDNNLTLFIRNLPFTITDEVLQEHFSSFGPVRYARVVLDSATERSRGTAFLCFYEKYDTDECLRQAPRLQISSSQASASTNKQSLLQDTSTDRSGRYTLEGRVVQVSRAVDKKEATRLTFANTNLRDARDKDKRRLYLLSEGTVPSGSPLYDQLSPTEVKMREDSARQRQTLIRSNPSLHLSLTRLSVRNIPRSITSKDLKALAREAVVGFATDVRLGVRKGLSKEELSRGGAEMREAEKARKTKGKGIVKQAKIVFEGKEGGKVAEASGAGRSRGYGFIEYSSHRPALMGLRWLNGHALDPAKGTAVAGSVTEAKERKKRLITEFAIENAQVVGRRQEKESKARERSMIVSEKVETGDLAAKKKQFSKDQLMAKTRKGTKRKRNSTSGPPEQKPKAMKGRDGGSTREAPRDLNKVAKRQQVIGRKRMIRKSRRSN